MDFFRHPGLSTKNPRFKNAIVGGETVVKGTQPWIGVIGSARFKDSTNGNPALEFILHSFKLIKRNTQDVMNYGNNNIVLHFTRYKLVLRMHINIQAVAIN